MTCLQWRGIRSYSHHLGGCHEGEELQTLVCLALPSRSSVTLSKSFSSLNKVSFSKHKGVGRPFEILPLLNSLG